MQILHLVATIVTAYATRCNYLTLSMSHPRSSSLDAEFAQFGAPGLDELDMAQVIDPSTMAPKLTSSSKIQAIKELVDRLHARDIVSDSLDFLQSVLERENLESTVLVGDVALPHARSRSVRRLGMAVGTCPEPMDFPSGDDLCGVRMICLIAVPSEAPGQYLGLLASMSRILSDDAFRNTLVGATTSEDMYDLLAARLTGMTG